MVVSICCKSHDDQFCHQSEGGSAVNARREAQRHYHSFVARRGIMPSETELLDEVTALKAQVAELQEKLQQAGGESAAKLV